jgi:outer membrane protein insertion porin family
LRSRGTLLTTLTALAFTVLAVRAMASLSDNSTQNQAAPTSPHRTALPGAIAEYQGLTVADIGLPDVPERDRKEMLELIPQKTGEALERELIRASIQGLYATGRFADIRVEAGRTVDGRVSLTFTTTPSYFVGDINVEGAPSRPTASQISNAAKLALGELLTRERLDRALKSIRQLMEGNGYYRSTATEEEQRNPATQQVGITFRLQAGARAHVGEVSVTGKTNYSQGQIQDMAKMHPGDPVSRQRTSEALDRLRKKYQKQNRLVAQVEISRQEYRPAANAVDYTFDITPGPIVDIAAEGFKISRRVIKRNVPVYEENALDDDLLNEGRRNLLNYMQTRGYFEAKVELRRSSSPDGSQMHIVYEIVPGAIHKLVKVEISGNQYFRDELLRTRMQVQPAGRLFSHGRYDQAMLNNDVKALEDLYRANAFEQIKITSDALDDYQGHENNLAVVIKVDEGPQTLVGAFHLEGNSTFSEAQLEPYLNTAEGQLFSEFNIAQDRDNILNYYFNHGFPQATFEAAAKPIPDKPHRMDVTFTIHEGERVFVDRVLLSGLHYTHPYVMQRELQMSSGDPLSQIDMLKTQQRLYDLGIFSLVDTAVQNPEGNEPEKNVLVHVEEAKRYTFNYGFGFEFQTGQPAIGTNQPLGKTGVSPRVSLDITRLNFRGRDHTISFKADVGELQQRGLISYTAPRWFGSPSWRLSFTGFYDNTLDVTTFTSQRLEGSVQAEQIINKASLMDYRFTYRRVKASNIEISPSEIPLLSLPVRVGEPGFTYIRNKRDNDLESTKGSYNTVDAGVASSYFGSEADFSRILVQNSTYHSFGRNRPREKKFVFARSIRVGVENAFGNTHILQPGQTCPNPLETTCASTIVIPLAERFLMGGGNSHRGFGLNQAGPRDPVTGFPLGGTALFLNNLELRFPPATLPLVQNNVSFAIFEDAGNVFVDGRDMLDNLLRWRQKDPQLCLQASTAIQCNYSYISHAIGIGVRYRTPIGPVRFDFGYNLNPPAFPSTQTVTNSSGQQTSTFVPQHAPHFNVYFSIGQSF